MEHYEWSNLGAPGWRENRLFFLHKHTPKRVIAVACFKVKGYKY